MDDDTPSERPLGPSQEGSDAALLVCQRMNDWRSPISRGELSALTGLPAEMLTLVLRGLRVRDRVVMLGMGPAATWQLKHHHDQQQGSAA